MADEIITKKDTEVESDSKTTKDAKPVKKKGPGLGKKMAKFFRDTKGEFKKIVWPTFPSVVRNTGVTLAMCAVLGLIVCVVDLGLSALIKLMTSLG